jgi:hypothetical protein
MKKRMMSDAPLGVLLSGGLTLPRCCNRRQVRESLTAGSSERD